MVYDGLDLKRDLLAAYDRQSQACTITWLSSDKHPVPLTFDDISHSLFAMSFDPYNCVELRWGRDGSGCPDQAGKRRWYAVEEQARHVTDPDRGTTAGDPGHGHSRPDRSPCRPACPGCSPCRAAPATLQ